jgi:hypothetical protein
MDNKTLIINKYYNILELLDKSPGHEEALDALIDLEQRINSHLFDVLKDKHGDKRQQSNVFSKFSK